MKHLVQQIALAAVLAISLDSVVAAESPPSGLTAQAIAAAKTPADHQAIADAYAKEAANLRARANEHRVMDKQYSDPGYLSLKLGAGLHCQKLVQAYEEAAKDADALAKAHREMAEAAATKK